MISHKSRHGSCCFYVFLATGATHGDGCIHVARWHSQIDFVHVTSSKAFWVFAEIRKASIHTEVFLHMASACIHVPPCVQCRLEVRARVVMKISNKYTELIEKGKKKSSEMIKGIQEKDKLSLWRFKNSNSSVALKWQMFEVFISLNFTLYREEKIATKHKKGSTKLTTMKMVP